MTRLKEQSFCFPDPSKTLDDGLLCIGGDLQVDTLREAYEKGIFPWPQEGFPLLWFSPPERGILEFDNLYLSKSLRKFIKKTQYSVTINQAFDLVIEECAKLPRPGQDGTWILPVMEEAYKMFHRAGHAHSFEIWQGSGKNKELVGGLYGVYVGGVFSGESMFFKKSNMSKLALVETIIHLQAAGLKWMDIQMVTAQLADMGGHYIAREEFQQRLTQAKDLPVFD